MGWGEVRACTQRQSFRILVVGTLGRARLCIFTTDPTRPLGKPTVSFSGWRPSPEDSLPARPRGSSLDDYFSIRYVRVSFERPATWPRACARPSKRPTVSVPMCPSIDRVFNRCRFRIWVGSIFVAGSIVELRPRYDKTFVLFPVRISTGRSIRRVTGPGTLPTTTGPACRDRCRTCARAWPDGRTRPRTGTRRSTVRNGTRGQCARPTWRTSRRWMDRTR